MSDGDLPAQTTGTDLAGLGTASKEIVRAFSDAIGTLYRPRAIRQDGKATADAEAYAIEVRAKAEARARMIEEDAALAIEQRAVQRLKAQEIQRQSNIEQVVEEAIVINEERCSHDARAVEPDWMTAFLNYAQDVSSEEVRKLWARVLADHSDETRPAVSRATLDSMRLLEPHMALAFERAMKMWMAMGQIMDIDESPIGPLHINEMEFLALTEIGFLRREDRKEPNLEVADVVLSFHGGLSAPDRIPMDPTEIRIDRLLPTWRGNELAEILYPGFYDLPTDQKLRYHAPEFADHADRAEVLTVWSEMIASRGYVVVLNTIEPKTGDAISGGITLTAQQFLGDDTTEWEALSEAALRHLGSS